jgi:hypothetical protein
MSRKLVKSKVAGSLAAEEGIEVVKRLSDINFESDGHHVSLVDEAANATKVLVMKAKQKTEPQDNPMSKEEKEVQEEVMKAKLVAEQKVEELKKARELEHEELVKSKEAQTVELEALKKAKESMDAELEELRKARDERETAEFVSKAKELKVEDADAFGTTLKKCKYALESAEYEALVKQLEKLENIEKNKDLLDNLGEANAEQVEKSKDDKFNAKRSEYIEKGLKPAAASKKARIELASEEA